MINFLVGSVCSVILAGVYLLGSVINFSYAEHGKPIGTVLPKVSPYAMNNLGKMPSYIAVKHYNTSFSDQGKHADLINLVSKAKQGVVLILWTPTCPKCKTQLKALAQLSKKYKHIKFVSVVTTFSSSIEDARHYWKKNVGSDHNMILVEDLPSNQNSIFRTVFTATNQAAVPMTVFINKNLDIVSAVAGAIKWDLHASRLMNCSFDSENKK